MCPKTAFRSEALDLMTSLADDITSQLAVTATPSEILDAYLWRMGKFCNGNFSLLFNESDYRIFVTNLGLKDKDGYQLHLLFPMLKSNNGKAEFTDAVDYQCRAMPFDNIVDNLSNAQMTTKLLGHWKNIFSKTKK